MTYEKYHQARTTFIAGLECTAKLPKCPPILTSIKNEVSTWEKMEVLDQEFLQNKISYFERIKTGILNSKNFKCPETLQSALEAFITILQRRLTELAAKNPAISTAPPFPSGGKPQKNSAPKHSSPLASAPPITASGRERPSPGDRR